MISTESHPGNGSRTKGSVLVVDDNPDNLRLLTGILTEKGYKVRPAPSGSLALTSVQSTLPDVILLDIKMPGMDGYEVCRRLKSDERTRDVPVLFISALDEVMDKIKGFGVGGIDYITKPFQHEEVLARVETHVSLSRMHKRLEQARNELEDRVRERTADLAQANEALRQSERKLSIRNRIAGIFLTVPDEEIYGEILQFVLEVMKSKYGIFGYINEDAAYVCPSMTRDVWDQCRVPDKDIVFPRETWGGIWGRALIEKKTLYSNEPFRVPEGHIPITRALDVPIIHQEEVIGNLLVANKGIDYDDNDQAMLETVASHIAPILSARLQRDRQEGARKLAEETLREGERRYRELADSLPQVVFEMDEKGIFTFVNRNAFDISGYTQSDFDKGFNAFQMLIPEDRERALENMQRVLNGEIINGAEYTALRKDGSTFPVIIHTNPVMRDNKPIGLRGIVIDLTEQKKMEADLTRRAMAMDQSMDTIVITDTNGTITYVNPAFEKITGYSRKEAIGENPSVLKSGKQDEAFYRRLWQTISGGKTWIGQFINKKKDGSHYTEEATISPVFSPSGEIVNYVAVKRDITDKINLETQLRQSQKMEGIGRLAGGVAHDFNNLLMSIMGHADLALMSLAEDDPLRGRLEQIIGGGERAASLTRQLLAFSRKQILQPVVLDPNSLITGFVKMLERLIGEDVELETVLASGLRLLEADPGQMEQIIMNLAVNARDAMPDGGKLTIETVNADLNEDYAKEHDVSLQPGPYVMLGVSDTGMGMDDKTKSLIFEPFFTTKEVGKGTGLGLSTVYGIVKQSGGYIWVYSEPGHGTTFKIYLPAVEGEAVSRKEKEISPERLTGSETILIVEDDDKVRNLGREILEPQGYSILEAKNGIEALRVSEEHGDQIHLMIADVVMPKMGGRELEERLRPLRPEMKVVYMSGYTDETIVHHGVLEPGIEFLQKPLRSESLKRKVREVLDA